MAKNVRYQIFVSSTYTDLIPVRRQVTEQILSMNHIPAGMEMFSASGRQQWATIQKAIDNSDYYVLIVGERYGSISPDDGISYTEKEFNYAVSKKIPTLCFLPGTGYSTRREHRDNDAGQIQKLELFKSRLQQQLCSFWDTSEELVNKVSASLYKIFNEEPGTGWIRGDAADPDALTKLVSAMEENQLLRNRILLLEEQNRIDLPILSIQLNNHDFGVGPLVLDLPDPNMPVSFIPELLRAQIPSHLDSMISDADIEAFNTSKPSEDEIREHNDALRFFHAGITGKLAFTIRNEGPVKANNVSIRIVMPEGISMIEEDDLDKLVEPNLSMPFSPVAKAEAKYQAQLRAAEADKLPEWLKGMSTDAVRAYVEPSFFEPLKLPHQYPQIYVYKNGVVAGKRESVRQTTTETLRSELYLVPSQRGQFSLSVEILCDEFREWHKSTLEIIIR